MLTVLHCLTRTFKSRFRNAKEQFLSAEQVYSVSTYAVVLHYSQ